MDIKKSIRTAQNQLGIKTLRRHQVEPINSILVGQDTMVIAPTSAGKSAIYQVPALIFPGMTLVIEPTLSLMYDQVNKLKAHGIKAEYIDSVMKSDERQKILNHARAVVLIQTVIEPCGTVKCLLLCSDLPLQDGFLTFSPARNGGDHGKSAGTGGRGISPSGRRRT